MANISTENINRPAPKWFRKTQKAAAIIQDTVIVFLLAMGYTDQSLLMLWVRIGVSNALKVVEAIIAED